jgi:hypothetical protein
MSAYKPGSFVRVHGSIRINTARGSPLLDPDAVTLRVRSPKASNRPTHLSATPKANIITTCWPTRRGGG